MWTDSVPSCNAIALGGCTVSGFAVLNIDKESM